MASRTRRDAAWSVEDGLDAGATGTEWLVREFLARFQLPADLVQLAAALAPGEIDDAVKAELLSLRFKGDVLTPDTSDELAPGALIGIVDEHVTVLLATQFVSVIVDKSQEIAKAYNKAMESIQGNTLTFEHFQPEPFATYIEWVVARSLLGSRLLPHPFRAGRLRRQALPSFTLVSRAPVEPDLLADVRRAAIEMAREGYAVLGKPPELP